MVRIIGVILFLAIAIVVITQGIQWINTIRVQEAERRALITSLEILEVYESPEEEIEVGNNWRYEVPDLVVQGNQTVLPTPEGYEPQHTGKLAWYSAGRIVVFNLETGEMLSFGGIGGLTNPRWFPDGQRLLVSAQHIWILDTRDATFKRVSPINPERPSARSGAHADVSPDGRYVAYIRSSLNRKPVFVDLEEGTVTDVEIQTDLEGVMGSPIWIPDNQKVSFHYGVKSELSDVRPIYTMDVQCMAEGRCELEQLTFPPDEPGLRGWHPSGESILYLNYQTNSVEIIQFNLATRIYTTLFNIPGSTIIYSMDYDKTGEYLAYIRTVHTYGERSTSVFISDIAGEKETLITDVGGSNINWWQPNE